MICNTDLFDDVYQKTSAEMESNLNEAADEEYEQSTGDADDINSAIGSAVWTHFWIHFKLAKWTLSDVIIYHCMEQPIPLVSQFANQDKSDTNDVRACS